jgi:1-acyl-sn-glycerol-3-phosphate acyltransferase
VSQGWTPDRPVDIGHEPPSAFRVHALRLFCKVIAGAYVRTTVIGAEHLPPTGSYILVFNHPSWADPIYIVGSWPDRERILFFLGPREEDMTKGIRNRLIAWTRRDIAFRPDGSDAVDATRRAMAVLRSGHALTIAGEGRISDREGEVLPLEAGLAHFGKLSRVPIVPVAIIGSRWIHFGKRITLSIGEPVSPGDFGRGKAGTQALLEAVQERFRELVEGAEDGEPPGWLGRTISEAFNDRPWLDAPESDPDAPESDPDARS